MSSLDKHIPLQTLTSFTVDPSVANITDTSPVISSSDTLFIDNFLLGTGASIQTWFTCTLINDIFQIMSFFAI